MITIGEALRTSARRLERVGIEEYRVESEYLVAAALQIPRTHLILQQNRSLHAKARAALRRWTAERAKRKPLAYVLGDQPFMGLELSVNSAVLIPRPETELLVEQAIKILENPPSPPLQKGGEGGFLIVDVGTGSGNIAISLAQHIPQAQVIGIDLSPAALRLARINARKNDVAHRCRWRRGDLLRPLLSKAGRAQMVIANLPYVKTHEIESLEPELQWEPRLALDGGPDGLKLIFRLIDQAREVLSVNGVLLLEIAPDQAKKLNRRLESDTAWTKCQVFKDLAGLPRIVEVHRKDIHGHPDH